MTSFYETEPTVALDAARNCVISLWNEQGWTLDKGMLGFVMGRIVTNHALQAKTIDIYPQERVPADAEPYKHPGWLEWTVRIEYYGGGGMAIGCIQRAIGAEYESHS